MDTSKKTTEQLKKPVGNVGAMVETQFDTVKTIVSKASDSTERYTNSLIHENENPDCTPETKERNKDRIEREMENQRIFFLKVLDRAIPVVIFVAMAVASNKAVRLRR